MEDNIEKTKKEIKQLTQYFWSKDTAIVFELEESLRKMKEYGETLIKERDLALEEKQNFKMHWKIIKYENLILGSLLQDLE